ncbi:MAG: hypothetical protein P1V19_18955 [Gimesia sp.]|nr:hypothetical protein [Gimesia sp.]
MPSKISTDTFAIFLEFLDDDHTIKADAQLKEFAIEIDSEHFPDRPLIIQVQKSTSPYRMLRSWWSLATGNVIDVLARKLIWFDDEEGVSWLHLTSAFTSELQIAIRPVSKEDVSKLTNWVKSVKDTH